MSNNCTIHSKRRVDDFLTHANRIEVEKPARPADEKTTATASSDVKAQNKDENSGNSRNNYLNKSSYSQEARKRIIQAELREQRSFQELLNQLETGNEQVLSRARTLIEAKEQEDSERMQKTYELWKENVHSIIADRIQHLMDLKEDNIFVKGVGMKKNGVIFYNTQDIVDPIKAELVKADDERKLLKDGGETDQKYENGIADVEEWVKFKEKKLNKREMRANAESSQEEHRSSLRLYKDDEKKTKSNSLSDKLFIRGELLPYNATYLSANGVH